MITINIDDKQIQVEEGTTILEAAQKAEIYIPTLCYHPDLKGSEGMKSVEVIYQGEKKIINSIPEGITEGCGMCLIEVQGSPDLVLSCSTEVTDGMVVVTNNDRIKEERKKNLATILTRHPHACLVCPQQEGCDRLQCSSDVPVEERCCSLFGHCGLQNIANYIGIDPATPRWLPASLPIIKEEPLFERNYNLCIGCLRCVRACNNLREVGALGFIFDEKGEIQVGSSSLTLQESDCRFCTACVEACPTGALIDKDIRAGHEEEDIVPCREACPAHIDIPRYLRLIAQDKRDEANAVIREKVPFPGILGRVCIHPCEEACRRGEVNEPISICALKRYAADGDTGLWKQGAKVKDKTGKKVAIVGSGPAGLTAAFYLKKLGHAVTVFESRKEAGGMMRYGIPAYRLPRDILDKEIKDILDLGIEFRPNQALGKDFTLEQLKTEGYDAVFLGVGAQLSRRIPVERAELADVLWGVDFLGQVAEGEDIHLKDRVIVIGGGNVAVDVARSAFRLGAKEVCILYRRSRAEMPAYEEEVMQAINEGISIIFQVTPNKISQKDGKLNLECFRIELGETDASGRRRPIPIKNSNFDIEFDDIIVAIGQKVELPVEFDLLPGPTSGLKVDANTLATSRKGVFAGGDVVTGPATVIEAVVMGRKAAQSIDKVLGGTGDIEEVLLEKESPTQFLGRDEGFALWPREGCPEIELEGRHRGFDEVSLGYTDEQAQKEAKRCLQCDLRLLLGSNPSPPEKVLAFTEENINQVPEEEGVFQLYDEDHNVIALKGAANIREGLLEDLEEKTAAAWFDFEEDKMYSKRESELIQKYLQEHGEMPGGGEDELDDLF